MSSQDDKFEHHGIKGQKWGVPTQERIAITKAIEFSNELLKKNPYLAIPRFQLPKHKVKRSDGKEKSKDGDKELKGSLKKED